MAQARALREPPIQEAVVQIKLLGAGLKVEELKELSKVYQKDGWTAEEIHTFEATVRTAPKSSPEVLTAGDFVGVHVTAPGGNHLVQLRSTQVAASTSKYRSWEELVEQARSAFDRYVAFARPTAISGLSARFINRIAPYPGLASFDQILTRPPLPIEDLPGAKISDFLRRHVMTGLEADFSALLTIGTVETEVDEGLGDVALVIDTDVRKACNLEPNFDLLSEDLTVLRSIKNKLFFGSLTEEVMERFQ